MSRVILCLSAVAFVYAAPPIVPAKPEPAKPEPERIAPVKPEAVKAEPVKPVPIKPELLKFEPIKLEPVEHEPVLAEDEPLEASGPCEDGVNNVIEVADAGDSLRIHTQGVVAHTYDENGNPTCYKGRARLSLPGILKLVKGKVIVTAPSDLKKSGDVLMTLKKNSRFVGTVCQDGKSKSKLIPQDMCRQSLSPEFEEDLLTMLSTPGTYDLATIEEKAGMGTVIKLEGVNAASKMLVKGDWQSISTLVSDGKVVARVKAPSNGDWLYIS